ncbi:MAG TPA: dipeptide epimerase [Puia sp.]|nr:dipeptide epimerase [Puia sp.]
MKIKYISYNLRFKYPFTISRGTKTHQPTLIVSLEQFGQTGFGEAPAITYYNIPVEKMIADLELKLPVIEKFAFTEPSRFWHFLHHLIPDNPFLVCALDIAAWDLYGKIQKKPLYDCWKLDINEGPLTDYTIGIDTVEKMVEKMQAKPWPIYKIKLGTPDDATIIRALRKHTDAILRVDANSGWTLQQALDLISALGECGVEFIEQPLEKSDLNGMRVLYDKSPIPLIADESCVSEQDVEKCHGLFHGINIKLTKCSGLTPALRMIENARKLGMKVMAGSMNESTIGTAAIGHLLPLLDYVDMDGTLLLDEDIATGLEIVNGKVILSGKPGLGIVYTGLPLKS